MIEICRIEVLGIPGPAEPRQHRLVLLVGGIGNGLKDPVIAAGAATILRRAGPGAIDQAWIGPVGVGGKNLLYLHRVLPEIPKIISVGKALSGAHQAAERGRALVQGRIPAVAVVGAVPQATNVEVVQVVVPPPEGRLNHGVQLGEGRLARDLQPAPDRRFDLADGYPQLVNGVIGSHATNDRRPMGRLLPAGENIGPNSGPRAIQAPSVGSPRNVRELRIWPFLPKAPLLTSTL